MRVNRLLIKESGVLKNINTTCTQVNLIIGDNEKGKTTLLNWISKGLFDKNQNLEHFKSFYPVYDGERMKNLLYIKETDLLFKYKNQEDLHKREYWNNEIHTLLYGNDDVSPILQKSFLRSMGVKNKNSWLVTLHEELFNLKNTLEDMLPDLEKINSKSQGLFELNKSLNSIHQTEKTFLSKDELYFYTDKIKVGENYLELWYQHQKLQEDRQEIHDLLNHEEQIKFSLTQKDDLILDLEDKIDKLKLDLNDAQQKEQQVLTAPFDTYNKGFGEMILHACVGMAMLITSLSLAFQSMREVGLTTTKMIALSCFIIGAFYLLKTIVHSFSLQKLSQSSEDSPNLIHKTLIRKAQDVTQNISNKLEQTQKQIDQLSNETTQMRRDLNNTLIKLDGRKNDIRNIDFFMQEFEDSKHDVLKFYDSCDADVIKQDIKIIRNILIENSGLEYHNLQQLQQTKQNIISQQHDISSEFTTTKNRISQTIKSLLDKLYDINNQKMIKHFYPELYSLKTNDLSNYEYILDTVEFLINKVGNDRYRAEKLVNIFHQMENNSEQLLSKTLESHFFEYLTQNIFGGKYHRFTTKSTPKDGFRIYAETYEGELFPLESLSTGTFAQFWFMLRLGIAKTILKNQHGILLLDDPFTSFDPVRKQYFLDAINALVHQGWQIFITITDDKTIHEYFTSVFQPVLTVIDLNKHHK